MDATESVLVFLAVADPIKNPLDDMVFTGINVVDTQQAIDMASTLDKLYNVPAYVSVGKDLENSTEIFANQSLKKIDEQMADLKAQAIFERSTGL